MGTGHPHHTPPPSPPPSPSSLSLSGLKSLVETEDVVYTLGPVNPSKRKERLGAKILKNIKYIWVRRNITIINVSNTRFFGGPCDVTVYDLVTSFPFIVPIQGHSETNVKTVIILDYYTRKDKFL